jgi:hypothetical protein
MTILGIIGIFSMLFGISLIKEALEELKLF